LTARHPIKPTSRRCLSAWQPNPGRPSTYRCGDSVQTTETTSEIVDAFELAPVFVLVGRFLIDDGSIIDAIPKHNSFTYFDVNRHSLNILEGMNYRKARNFVAMLDAVFPEGENTLTRKNSNFLILKTLLSQPKDLQTLIQVDKKDPASVDADQKIQTLLLSPHLKNVLTRQAVCNLDGTVLVLASPPAAINATLYEKLNFNFIRDIAPVASVISAPFVMEVNPSVPAKTVPEFIAYAKSNPGKVSMASAGVGSGPHLAGELFKIMAGANIVIVPYRGTGPALTDLIGGQVQLYFDAIPASIEYIRTGKLRALAVTTVTRSELLPETPALGDFLPGYEVTFWSGVGAPKNTPIEIIERLNKEINGAFADPKVKARLADLGGTVLPGSPTDFGKLIAAETEKWGKVIRAANIKAE
jgi:tripartite-type tricarboxylate transporter receptor subunit TctC